MSQDSRARRERKTIRVMVSMYCAHHHSQSRSSCQDCADLITYSEERLARCVFQRSKPTCAKCPVHCYEPKRREQMRAVMRYSGPRMLSRHPVMAILHLYDGARKPKRSEGLHREDTQT